MAIYRATTKLKSLPLTMAGVLENYTAAEVTLSADSAFVSGKNEHNDYMPAGNEAKVVRLTNRAYIDPPFGGKFYGNEDEDDDGDKTVTVTYQPDKNHEEIKALYRAQGLYQLGPVSGKKPLTVSDVVISKSTEIPDGMHSIQCFTDMSETAPFDIGYYYGDGKAANVYLYLRGSVEEEGKYISGLDVATYERPKDTEKHTYTEQELQQIGLGSDDSCIMGLCSKVNGEILNYNIAINQEEAWYNRLKEPVIVGRRQIQASLCLAPALWYNNLGTKNTAATYIGVSRTNDSALAITRILMYRAEKLPPVRITVGGAEYHRTGDKAGDYYFYYTKCPAASPGLPIEELTLDDVKIIDGTTVVPGATGADEEGKASYMEEFNGCHGYFHMKTNMKEALISRITLVTGNYKTASMEAMRNGCNYVKKVSLNANTDGTEIYLAYKMCSSEVLSLTAEDLTDAKKEYEEEREGDAVPNREGMDTGDDASRQDGMETGDDASKQEGTDTGDDASKQDGMDNSDVRNDGKGDIFGSWEMLLDEQGNEVNLNEGIMAWDYEDRDEHYAVVKDTRLFLFIQRLGGKVKRAAAINRGYVQESFTTGDLIMR